MELFVLSLGIIILIILIQLKGKVNSIHYSIYDLERDLSELQGRVDRLRKQLTDDDQPLTDNVEPTVIDEPVVPEVSLPADVVKEELPAPVPPINDIESVGTNETSESTEVYEDLSEEVVEDDVTLQDQEMATAEPEIRTRNIEKLIGVDFFSKIGILVLVIGLGLFVKFAIDKNWINETMRVILGMMAGLSLWGLASKLRNNYANFSSILAGGGFAVCFVTVAVGYNYYHLFASWVAFSILIVLMIAMTLIALRWNDVWLAMTAVIGGFVAPFLVGDENGNFVGLCVYMAILDAGVFYVTLRRNWWQLIVAACLLTYIVQCVIRPDLSVQISSFSIIFNLFYFILFSLPLVMAIRKNESRSNVFILLVGSLIINDFAFLAASIYYAEVIPVISRFTGVFSIIVAAVNAVILFFYSSKADDTLIQNILLGIIIVFSLMFFPIQFSSLNVIISGVAVCGLILFVAYIFTCRDIFLVFSLCCLCGASLYLTEYALFYISKFGAADFWTCVIVGSSILATSVIMQYFVKQNGNRYFKKADFYRIGALWVGLFFIVLGSCMRLSVLFEGAISEQSSLLVVLTALCLVSVFSKDSGRAEWFLPLLSALAYSIVIFTSKPLCWILMIGCDVMTACLLFSEGRKHFTTIRDCSVRYMVYFNISAMLFLVSAVEAGLMASGLNSAISAGFSISVMICGIIQLLIGMKYHTKSLRMIGLCSFGIVLVKVVVYDLWSLPMMGRIIVFVSLGVLLLVISFLYQKLRSALFEE